jgi:hypothetical protein
MKRVLFIVALVLVLGLVGCAKLDPYDPHAVAVVSQRLSQIQRSGDITQQEPWIADPVRATTTVQGLGSSQAVLAATELQARGGEPLVVAPTCSLGPPIFTNLRSTVETSQTLTCRNMPMGHLTVNMAGSYASRWEKRGAEWVMTRMETELAMQ